MKATTIALLALCAASREVVAQRPTMTESELAPAQSQARGVDAEIRVALFELLADRPTSAMRRLQWLSASPISMDEGALAGSALRGRQDLGFLLAEAQYRFGMDSAFRATAEPLLPSGTLPTKYASLLQSQLLLAAYRTGDYAGVVRMARSATEPSTRGLAALVSGLASYQIGNLDEARRSFADARQAGGAYAPYAEYMDVLTTIRMDTARSASALQQLQLLGSSATGGEEFADQVRLTAAQLAYERGAYDEVVSIVGSISDSSGYAAPALLTAAWAQYKAERIDDAGQRFARFADRHPQLPERDEARLMAAQSLLQLGRTDEAGRVFAAVADSVSSEARGMQGTSLSVISDAAHALVAARAAGLLFIPDPAGGKTVVLQDRAGADPALLAMAVSDTIVVSPHIATTQLLSLNDVRARFDSVQGLPAAFPRRVLFTPASATTTRSRFSRSVQALYAADVDIAMARNDLAEQLRMHEMQRELLRSLQVVLAERRDSLMAVASQLERNRLALSALMGELDAAHSRLRAMLVQQASLVRAGTSANERLIDSLGATLGPNLTDEDRAILSLERQTTETYRRTAEMLLPRIDSAIARHPVFALRDTVQMRRDSIGRLLAATRDSLASVEALVSGELARLEREPEAIIRLRTALADAEARRRQAEERVVEAVDAELRARSTELLAGMRRSAEAAEFGKASASFFRALDQGGQGSRVGATGGAPVRPGAPAASTADPQR